MKPIPNRAAQDLFNRYDGYDGELIVGDPAEPDCYRKTVSCCMTANANAIDLTFRVFDNIRAPGHFDMRLKSIVKQLHHPHAFIHDAATLAFFEQTTVDAGHEGIITRSFHGGYKNGRSTMQEQGMVKIKRFLDDEATVVGFEEQMHNANAATTNVQGYTERTSHKANKQGMGVLGALIVTWRGKEFRIGTGFTALERIELWNNKIFLVGKKITFKYLPIGMKDLPRHPVFLRWREE